MMLSFERAPASGGTPAEAGTWTLFFIAATLLALALIPYWVGQRVAEVDDEISQTLEPARSLASDLALVQARAMARFQEYLLTGESAARRRYHDLVAREGEISTELQDVLAGTELRLREQVLPLLTASSTWHMGHRAALESEDGRAAFLERIEEDQRRFDLVLQGSQRLRDALTAETQRARIRMQQNRSLQLSLTIGLVALALLATAAVGLLGRRLQGLMREARSRSHEALRARREIDAVLEATGDGVVSVDLDGHANSINATGSRLLGYSAEEARGRSVHELVHGSDPGEAGHTADDCPIIDAVRLGVVETARDDEARHRRGRRFPIRWALRPLVDGREVRGAVLTLADMTQVREAERALREAVHAREQTMAVVSHDLRNPLGSVSAAAELLLDVPLSEDRRRQQLEIIQRASERMNRLIQDLLDVARIDAGGLSVRPRAIAVEPLLVEGLELMEPRLRERGLEWGIEHPDHALPEVRADHDRILQVLSNLLVNAVRHTPRGGRITLGAEARDGEVVVRVADTGAGVPEDARAHLFDRFWRPDDSDREGAGLGLAIVKGIVEAHGGRVWLESEVGEGSSFYFSLPAAS
jgi:PAS domain S-box-containing protein